MRGVLIRTRRGMWRVAAGLALTAAAGAAPLYDIYTLGFTDAEHVSPTGQVFCMLSNQSLNAAGQMAGTNGRYDPATGASRGQSAWFYDAPTRTLVRLGFTGVGYERSDGYRSSDGYVPTARGEVSGSSTRYSGSTYLGTTAWLYDHRTGVTTVLGNTDATHTRADGYQASYAGYANAVGLVPVNSLRFTGGADWGQSAWLQNVPGGGMTRVGFTGAAYTRSDGYQYSQVSGLHDNGLAIGRSSRYSGGTQTGQAAWVYDVAGGTTTRIGLTDAAHTRTADGYQDSYPSRMTADGLVQGYANSYAVPADPGLSPWLYRRSSGTTVRLGYTDATHTRADGYQRTDNVRMSESGYLTGQSYRFSGSTNMGQSAWLYRAATSTTTRIGFFSGAYIRADGYQNSTPYAVNHAGQVAGTSSRFSGSTSVGTDAWVYSPATGTTLRAGLTDARHTGPDGYQASSVSGGDYVLNGLGHLIGTSSRYNGAAYAGSSGWFFDPAVNQTWALVFSERSDAYAVTSPQWLTDDGLVLGGYKLYAADDSDLGYRAFRWSVADGFMDLGALVSGGLGANGWDQLWSGFLTNARGDIAGGGKLSVQVSGQAAYLLTVNVPEPGAAYVLVLVIGFSFRACRRRVRVAC